MANEQNLTHVLTASEQRKGGRKSAEARKEKKRLRESLEALLDGEIEMNGTKISVTEAMAATAVQAALRGDWKAWELVRDTSGQKPVDKVVAAEVDPSVIEEVEQMVTWSDGDDTAGSG